VTGRAPRVLVTAGPTREPIDAVRFVSNRSSGKMGYAIAVAALEAGADVTLVSGPVALDAPPGARVVRVETAREMHRAALAAFARCDLAFHVAAVADFRPANPLRGKLKKEGRGSLVLHLAPNPDILLECGRRKRAGQILVGFALEASDGERNARSKLRRKNLDLVVLNAPSALDADATSVLVLGRDGARRALVGRKGAVAQALVRMVFSLRD